MLVMSSTYTTLNNGIISPCYTNVGSIESLILEPRSTPIPTISNSLILFRNCQRAQASNTQIHRSDGSMRREMSTLASSTLGNEDQRNETIPNGLVKK